MSLNGGTGQPREFRVAFEADVEADSPVQAAQHVWDQVTGGCMYQLPILTVTEMRSGAPLVGAHPVDIDLEEETT